MDELDDIFRSLVVTESRRERLDQALEAAKVRRRMKPKDWARSVVESFLADPNV